MSEHNSNDDGDGDDAEKKDVAQPEVRHYWVPVGDDAEESSDGWGNPYKEAKKKKRREKEREMRRKKRREQEKKKKEEEQRRKAKEKEEKRAKRKAERKEAREKLKAFSGLFVPKLRPKQGFDHVFKHDPGIVRLVSGASWPEKFQKRMEERVASADRWYCHYCFLIFIYFILPPFVIVTTIISDLLLFVPIALYSIYWYAQAVLVHLATTPDSWKLAHRHYVQCVYDHYTKNREATKVDVFFPTLTPYTSLFFCISTSLLLFIEYRAIVIEIPDDDQDLAISLLLVQLAVNAHATVSFLANYLADDKEMLNKESGIERQQTMTDGEVKTDVRGGCTNLYFIVYGLFYIVRGVFAAPFLWYQGRFSTSAEAEVQRPILATVNLFLVLYLRYLDVGEGIFASGLYTDMLIIYASLFTAFWIYVADRRRNKRAASGLLL